MVAEMRVNDTAIIQTWNSDARVVPVASPRPLFPDVPRMGMVVGTYAAVPYVHLQLEARKRFYPTAPLLVHDDGSHKSTELHSLCELYGCDFEFNETRQPPTIGDLTAFFGGLLWAKFRSLDLIIKVSRRWIFRTDWTFSLAALAVQSQYATFSSYTTSFNFGFRTECVGLAMRAWTREHVLTDLAGSIEKGQSVFVEAHIHEHARQFERQNTRAAEQWRQGHPMPSDRTGYALWTLLGTDRCERSPFFLWHDSCGPQDYYTLAREWGLPYTPDDFADPNQGAGDGT
jgi:hypothetical protein